MKVNNALQSVAEHVEKHSDNKYQHSIIDTEKPLRNPQFTLLTANKYIARYLATAGEKNGNPEDLKKAIHFILFELQLRIMATEKYPVDLMYARLKELDTLATHRKLTSEETEEYRKLLGATNHDNG